MLRPSNILTNYYKIAHLHDISYRIYTAVDASNEQMLLELEVQIRHDHPSILINYYNRSLFVFQFSHVATSIDLQELYPQLKLLLSHSSSPKELTTSRNARPATDDPVPYAGLCFLKAVKKLLLYNLSRSGALRLFGNYSVISEDDTVYNIVHIDPILLPNGDVLVAMDRRTRPQLLSSSVLDTQLSSHYAIYLIPSGIRCHLYEPSLEASLSSEPPSNHKGLTSLLERAIGVSVSPDTPWVKLIPNLQHLNNQTSPISQFVHTVDNKKYILWPWSLCLVHIAHQEQEEDVPKPTVQDPIDMISEFLDFSINIHLHLSLSAPDSSQHPPFSIPSILSTGASGEAAEIRDSAEAEAPISPLVGPSNDNEQETQVDDDENEIDDLFGDNSEPETEKSTKPEPVKDEPESVAAEVPDIEMQSPTAVSQAPKKESESPAALNQNDSTNNSQIANLSYVDIPKDQMLTKEQMLASFRATPQTYDDPGAPPAIMPTPIVPQHYNNIPREGIPSKSVFSPILFNPLIKNNIDTKYGKGGKFYVEKDSSVGLDEVNSKTRATSVLASQSRDGTLGLGITRQQKEARDYEEVFDDSNDSDKDMTSEDESDEDEAAESAVMEGNLLPLRLNMTDNVADSAKPKSNGTQAPASVGAVPNSVPATLSASIGALAFNTGLANVDSFYLPFMKNSKKDWNESVQLERELNLPAGSDKDMNEASDPPLRNLESEQEPPQELKQENLSPSSSSTNCLPLILRGINTSTIPDIFLANNIENDLLKEFIMDVEDDAEKSDLGNGMELKVKSEGLSDLLETLVPCLIYDDGLTNIDAKLEQAYIENEPPKSVQQNRVPDSLTNAFLSMFPQSYNIALFELLTPIYGQEDKTSFLDELTVTGMLQLEGEKLSGLEWDAIYPDTGNQEESNRDTYLHLIAQIETSPEQDECEVVSLKQPMASVKKNNKIVNMSSTALQFWKYLNFTPLSGTKDFQTVLVCDSDAYNSGSHFLDALTYCYNDCSFGTMTQLEIKLASRPELRPIKGTINIDYDNSSANGSAMRVVERELVALTEHIKLDLMDKSNCFDFKRPFLLLFASFDNRFNSHLQVAKLLRNFKQLLREYQLPIVEVFCHIIPASTLFKGPRTSRNSRYLSNSKLCRIAMNLYNRCPAVEKHSSGPLQKSIFATLAKEPPTKFRINCLPGANKDSKDAYSDDIFLHLAYERTIDKNWVAGVWSDPQGQLTYSKAWFCSPGQKSSKVSNSIDEVCDDLWSLSMDFFKTLAESSSKSMAGRKFLVLTRVNNVIPDDELLHWKRLSVKHKDISLIVLSVGKATKSVFKGHPKGAEDTEDKQEIITTAVQPDTPLVDSDVFRLGYGNSNNTSPAGLLGNSPNNINFLSPRQILNALGNFLSPQDLVSTIGTIGGQNASNGGGSPSKGPDLADFNRIMDDPSQEVFAIVPITTLPTINSPTRLAMKSGFLMSSKNGQMLQYEVSLLSCSSYWSPDAIMKIILHQYKNLLVLGDILCTRGKFRPPLMSNSRFESEQEASGIVPWHIAAVTKTLDYLVHVEVT